MSPTRVLSAASFWAAVAPPGGVHRPSSCGEQDVVAVERVLQVVEGDLDALLGVLAEGAVRPGKDAPVGDVERLAGRDRRRCRADPRRGAAVTPSVGAAVASPELGAADSPPVGVQAAATSIAPNASAPSFLRSIGMVLLLYAADPRWDTRSTALSRTLAPGFRSSTGGPIRGWRRPCSTWHRALPWHPPPGSDHVVEPSPETIVQPDGRRCDAVS